MTNEWLNDARKIPDEAMSYIRKLAVRAITDGRFRPTLVASVLNISTSAIYEWLDHYKKGGYDALDTRLAPGAEPRITREMDERIKAIVLKENPTAYGYDTQLWTCNIVAEVIEKIFLVKVLPSTVYVHLKKIGLSAQRPEYVARERDSVEIEQFLNDKFPRIQKLANKIDAEIAFEDEAGVDLTEHSGRTWGRIGETPKVIASGQRGRYNTLALVTPRGKLEYEVTGERVNSEIYIEFLEQALADCTKPLILLVDRASFHSSKTVRDFVRARRDRIRIYFLPKYAPDYNPTEQVWEEIKENNVRRQPIYSKFDLKKKLMNALKDLQTNTERVKSFFLLDHTKYAMI